MLISSIKIFYWSFLRSCCGWDCFFGVFRIFSIEQMVSESRNWCFWCLLKAKLGERDENSSQNHVKNPQSTQNHADACLQPLLSLILIYRALVFISVTTPNCSNPIKMINEWPFERLKIRKFNQSKKVLFDYSFCRLIWIKVRKRLLWIKRKIRFMSFLI